MIMIFRSMLFCWADILVVKTLQLRAGRLIDWRKMSDSFSESDLPALVRSPLLNAFYNSPDNIVVVCILVLFSTIKKGSMLCSGSEAASRFVIHLQKGWLDDCSAEMDKIHYVAVRVYIQNFFPSHLL